MKSVDISLLYIDDNKEMLDEVASYLKYRVKKLFTASNEEEAIQEYHRNHPDLIVATANSLDILKRIKEDDSNIPILIICSKEETDTIIDSINNNIDSYILKPINLDKLMDKIIKLAEPILMQKHIRLLNQKLIETNNDLEAKIAKAVQEHTNSLISQNQKMQKQAFYDTLTDIPNRAFIYELLEKELKKSKRHKTKFALFFLDLDNFKSINDTFGHEIGDKVLVEFAKRIKENIRESDSVGRLGGDEFLLIASDIQTIDNIKIFANKILKSITKKYFLDNLVLNVSCSIGISIYPDDAEDIGELIKYADIAMYEVKKTTKHGIKFYSDLKETK
jgi:diguanylate cyclase (GGDEF)-like protein